MTSSTGSAVRTTGLQDFAVNMATRAGVFLSGIAMQSLLAYTLLPAGRGAYAVAVLFASLLGVLLTPGADAGAQYFVMAKRISLSQGVSVAGGVCLLGAAIATALALPLINSDLPFFEKAESSSFYLALVLIPGTTFANALLHQLVGLRRFARVAIFSLTQSVSNALALVGLVLVLGFGVNGALLALCISNLVLIILCIRDLRKHAELTWELPAGAAFASVVRYGLRYYIARIGAGLDVRAGVLVLGLMAGRSEVGLFAVASGLMLNLLMISNAVFTPLLPRAAGSEGGRAELIAFCARSATWATGGALILLLSLATPLVRFLLSAEFVPVVSLIQIIAPGILVLAGAKVLTAYFRGINQPEVCSWAVGIGLGVNITLVSLLYPHLGVAAGAWGMTGGLIARSAWLSAAYCRDAHTGLALGWLPQRGDAARIRSFAAEAMNRLRQRPAND